MKKPSVGEVAALSLIALLAMGSIFSANLADPFAAFHVDFGGWAQAAVDWMATNARPFFHAIRAPIKLILDGTMGALTSLPPTLVIAVAALVGWQLGGTGLAVLATGGLLVIGIIGAWHDAMITLALTISSVVICIIIGIPLGIAAAKSDKIAGVVRPLLDIMQTCPAFVYLIPIVMLMGIGNVPGVAVTVIFALPPIVRLTDLGIRQVPETTIEAATAFGATKREILFDVELPLALRTIMTGVNQTLMMALSMVVVASMIAVEGLGLLVLRGIGRLDMGLASVGGVGIVLLAVVLDRLTQASAVGRDKAGAGPVGIVLHAVRAMARSKANVHGSEIGSARTDTRTDRSAGQ